MPQAREEMKRLMHEQKYLMPFPRKEIYCFGHEKRYIIHQPREDRYNVSMRREMKYFFKDKYYVPLPTFTGQQTIQCMQRGIAIVYVEKDPKIANDPEE